MNEIRKIISERMRLGMNIIEVCDSNEGMVITLESVCSKINIMKKKRLLRGTPLVLQDILTQRERQVMEWLRDFAR